MTPQERVWIEYVRSVLGVDAAAIAELKILADHRRDILQQKEETTPASSAPMLDEGQGMSYDPFYGHGVHPQADD